MDVLTSDITPRAFTDWMYMAKTVFGEARGENEASRKAVAWVIRNRVEDPRKRFGSSVPEVCTARLQFSAWNPGDMNREYMLHPLAQPTEHDEWYECVRLAREVLDAPPWANPIPGVMWYHDRSIGRPHWASRLQEVYMPGVTRFRLYRERG